MPPPYTFTRASPAWAWRGSALQTVGANVKPTVPGGFVFEPAATNLVPLAAYRMASGWTLTGVTAAAIAGIDGVAGAAVRLTATADGGTARLVVTSAAEYNALSFWGRRALPAAQEFGGHGVHGVWYSMDDGATWWNANAIGINGAWNRFLAMQRVSNPALLIRLDHAGDSFDFDWWQVEAGQRITGEVPGGATRAAASLTIETFGALTWDALIAAYPIIALRNYGIVGDITGGANPVIEFPAQTYPPGSPWALPALTVTL